MLGTLDRGVLALREIHRFANEPVRQNGSLQWDILHLWQEMRRALDLERESPRERRRRQLGRRLRAHRASGRTARRTVPLSRPPNQRRHGGGVRARQPRADLCGNRHPVPADQHDLPALRRVSPTPRLVDAARALVTIPDLLNYWLTGKLVSEYTVATTTQFIDARTRTWAIELLDEIGLPTRLLQPMVEAGDRHRHAAAGASATGAGTPVVAPACHDTASAVASVSPSGRSRFSALARGRCSAPRCASRSSTRERWRSISRTKAASAARRGC